MISTLGMAMLRIYSTDFPDGSLGWGDVCVIVSREVVSKSEVVLLAPALTSE